MYIVNEPTFSGYSVISLDLLYVIAILLGTLVIISKNPVVSVLFLIGLFLSISCYLILTGLNFIGLSYLLVYIGAVSILFLFILMLINIRLSELQENTINSIPLAILIIISLIYTIFKALPYNLITINSYDNIFKDYSLYKNKLTYTKNDNILFATTNNWDNNILDYNNISSIGSILYTSHNIWLIITSFILLLAMTGAIIITIKQK